MRAPRRTKPEQAGQTCARRTSSWVVDRISCPHLQRPRIVVLVRLRTVRNSLGHFAEMAAKVAPEIMEQLLDVALHPPEIVTDELRVEHAWPVGITYRGLHIFRRADRQPLPRLSLVA